MKSVLTQQSIVCTIISAGLDAGICEEFGIRHEFETLFNQFVEFEDAEVFMRVSSGQDL